MRTDLIKQFTGQHIVMFSDLSAERQSELMQELNHLNRPGNTPTSHLHFDTFLHERNIGWPEVYVKLKSPLHIFNGKVIAEAKPVTSGYFYLQAGHNTYPVKEVTPDGMVLIRYRIGGTRLQGTPAEYIFEIPVEKVEFTVKNR